MMLGMVVGLDPGHTVRWGPSSAKQVHSPPNFSPICGQTAGWIKMPLGREMGLCPAPGDIVLDGYPAPSPKKGGTAAPRLFGPCPLWPNGWMDQDAIWYRRRLWPRPHC